MEETLVTPQGAVAKRPFVSVIMPIRNESASIAQSLGAVLAQDYPPDRMEVLVVDGMSADGTREALQRTVEHRRQAMGSALPPVALLDNPMHIVPTAFNIGLRQARGEIIVRVDGHCEIAPSYVSRCVEALERTGADNVGGLQQAVGRGWVGKGIALATSSPFGVGNARFHYARKAGWVDTVYLGAFRREVFDRVGSFDEEMARNEDDEFNCRLIQAGGRIWLEPSIQSVYHNRGTLRELWRQYYQFGQYKVRLIQKRGAVPSWRHLVPGAFVLSLPSTLMLAVASRSIWSLGGVACYAVGNVAASLAAARRDWQTLPVLPAVFSTLHLAYGLGFLSGLWRWRGAWVPAFREPVAPAARCL